MPAGTARKCSERAVSVPTRSWKRTMRAPSYHGRNHRRAINTASWGVALFCQRASEKLEGRDLWACPPRSRSPWWRKSVTSVGQQEERSKTQQLYFLTLCVMEGCRPSLKTTNTVSYVGWQQSNRHHHTLAEVVETHQVAQNSTPSLLWMSLFKCRFNIGLSNPFTPFFGEGLIQHAKN